MTNEVNAAMAIIGKYLFAPLEARQDIVNKQGLDFAHYTSAETAFKIIETESFQMRNSKMMNDFSEIRLGLEAVKSLFYKTDKGASTFWNKMREHDKDFESIVEGLFVKKSRHLLLNSYIGSLSEYAFDQQSNGKLSMWRSYGFPNGVALIFKREEILSEAAKLDVYSYPVIYPDHGLHVPEFVQGVASLAENTEQLYDFSGESCAEALVNIILHLAVCIKDSNFREEQEWRIVYTEDTPQKVSDEAPISVSPTIISGVPQNVCRISLSEYAPIELKKILKAVIIGPTSNPDVAIDAFVRLLKEKQYVNPERLVSHAHIPFRG